MYCIGDLACVRDKAMGWLGERGCEGCCVESQLECGLGYAGDCVSRLCSVEQVGEVDLWD